MLAVGKVLQLNTTIKTSTPGPPKPPPIIDPPGIEAFNLDPNGDKMRRLKEDILLEPLNHTWELRIKFKQNFHNGAPNQHC